MKYLLTFLLILSTSIVQAQDEYKSILAEMLPEIDLTNAEYKVLAKDLEINTLILESIKEVQLRGGEFAQHDSTATGLRRAAHLAINARSVQLGDRVKQNITEAIMMSVQPKKLAEHLSTFLTNLKKNFQNKGALLSHSARRFGLQVGLFYLLAMQVDYTIPLILISTGEVAIGSLLFALPFSSVSTTMFASVRSLARYRYMLKTLGFKDTFEHYKIFKEMKSFFNRSFFGKDYLVDVNIAGLRGVLTVEESTAVSRLFQKLGYKKNLTYQTLVEFLSERGVYQKYVPQYIADSPQLKIASALKILSEIERAGDIDTMAAILLRFSNKASHMDLITNLAQQKVWFAKLASSQNMEDLFYHFRRMPQDMAPHTFAKVWRGFVLPNLSKSFGQYFSIRHYRTFRNLYNNFDKFLFSDLVTSSSTNLDRALENRIKDYLFESFSPLNSCEMVFRQRRGITPPFL